MVVVVLQNKSRPLFLDQNDIYLLSTVRRYSVNVEKEAGYIEAMKHKYPELLVFLTGGDDFSFDTNLKSIIFADRFLVLKGLNRILNYNNDRL